MDALQLLIHERMRELRLSYREVARRGGLPLSTVHHLATHGRTGRLPLLTTRTGRPRRVATLNTSSRTGQASPST